MKTSPCSKWTAWNTRTARTAGPCRLCQFVAFALLISASVLPAASIVWDGDTNTTFSDGNNWVGGVAPANSATTDTAVFGASITTNQPIMTANRSVAGLVFQKSNGGWTLGGSSQMGIGATGINDTANTSGTTTISANLTASVNTVMSSGTGGNLLLSGTMLFGGSQSLTVNSGTVTILTPAVVTALRAWSKQGAGTLILGNAASETSGGTLSFNAAAGTLVLGNKSAIGSGNFTLGGGTVQASTDLSGSNAITNTVSLTINSTISGTNNMTFSGNLTSTQNRQITSSITGAGKSLVLTGNVFLSNSATTGRTVTFAGEGRTLISGAIANFNGTGVAGNIANSGNGTTVLAGNNTYTGFSRASVGTLQFAKAAALYGGNTTSWTAAKIAASSGATLAFNVGGTGEFTTGQITTLLTNLAASTTIATNGMNSGSGIGFDTTNAAGGTFSISNVIANTTGTAGGARGLVKLGTNTLVLSGNSTYTGATRILAGTLLVNGSVANTAITVSSGTILGGNGTIGGPVTVEAGGSIQPPSSTGIQTFANGASYQAGSAFGWGLLANSSASRGTNYSGVNVTGGTLAIAPGSQFNINVNGPGSTVDFTNNFWKLSQSFLIFDGTTTTGNFTLGTVSNDINGISSSTYGTFSLSVVNNDVYLNWTPAVESLVTPADYVSSLTPPTINGNSTLSRLSTFWPYPDSVELNSVLAESWGYCMHLKGALSAFSITRDLSDPLDEKRKVVEKHLSAPLTYPLRASLSKEFYPTGTSNDDSTKEGLLAMYPSLVLRDASGTPLLNSNGNMFLSPEAPDGAFQQMAQARVDGINALKNFGLMVNGTVRYVNHLEVLLNSGEYGLFDYPTEGIAMKDPVVRAARGNLPWRDYKQTRAVHQEKIIFDAVTAAISHDVYLFYFTGNRDRGGSYPTDPGSYGTPLPWAWSTPITDLPSTEVYYKYGNGFGGYKYGTGSSSAISWDMLSTTLSDVAQNIEYGAPLSYSWLSAGDAANSLAPWDGYMGFLKCLYTAGMVGAIEQLYSNFDEFNSAQPNASFYPSQAPNWLTRMLAHSHVWALFTQMDAIVTNGSLLPGDGQNALSFDLPSYEFATGNANARVLVRKHNTLNEWLLTAWLALDTEQEDWTGEYVNVTVPTLGTLRVFARTCGTVYHVKMVSGNPVWKLLDEDADLPSHIPTTPYVAVDRAIVSPPTWDGIVPVLTLTALTNVPGTENTGDATRNLKMAPAYSAYGTKLVQFFVTLNQTTNIPLTVNWQLVNGTTSNADFVGPTSGSVVVPAGAKKCLIGALQPLNDTLKEGREKYGIELLAGSNYTLGTTFRVTGRSLFDDDKPTISTDTAGATTISEATKDVGFLRVTSSPVSATNRTVSFTMSGTAQLGVDYTLVTASGANPPQNQVVIPAGQREANITVVPISDALTEGSETIILTVTSSDPTNLEYINPTRTITLTD